MRSPVLITVMLVVMLVVACGVAVVAFAEPAHGETRVVTANVGRSAPWPVRRAAVRRTPLGVTGWQEIDKRERRAIRRARPNHRMVCARTRTPVTVPPGRRVLGYRITWIHRGYRGVTKSKRICEVHLDNGQVVLNTHLVSGAHSRPHQRAEQLRSRLWRKGWRMLNRRATQLRRAGHQVWITADLNRSQLRKPDRWRVLATSRNDYVIATPKRLRVLGRAKTRLRIDGHHALRVTVRGARSSA